MFVLVVYVIDIRCEDKVRDKWTKAETSVTVNIMSVMFVLVVYVIDIRCEDKVRDKWTKAETSVTVNIMSVDSLLINQPFECPRQRFIIAENIMNVTLGRLWCLTNDVTCSVLGNGYILKGLTILYLTYTTTIIIINNK